MPIHGVTSSEHPFAALHGFEGVLEGVLGWVAEGEPKNVLRSAFRAAGCERIKQFLAGFASPECPVVVLVPVWLGGLVDGKEFGSALRIVFLLRKSGVEGGQNAVGATGRALLRLLGGTMFLGDAWGLFGADCRYATRS